MNIENIADIDFHKAEVGTASIILENISKSFSTQGETIKAIRPSSLHIQQGEITVFVGPSGSGKSTLLSIAGALEKSDTGLIKIAGRVYSDPSASLLARIRRDHIGFLFQDAGLIERMSVLDNVCIPLMYRNIPADKRVSMAKGQLEKLGLIDRLHHTPGRLSGGERQRAGLARALVTSPDVLICDEPTAALDDENSLAVCEELRTLANEGQTVVIATHDKKISAIADTCYEVRSGEIRALKCHQSKMDKSSLIKAE